MTGPAAIAGIARRRPVRILVGVAISLAFLLATLSRVDLHGALDAFLSASPGWLLVGLAGCAAEVGLRSWRWQLLLRPLAARRSPIRYRAAVAYECVGYFANSLLPMRMGDVARAYLAGTAFGVPRLATLGTVLVERVADGLSILVIAFVLGLFVAGGGNEAITAASILVVIVGGSTGLWIVWLVARGRLLRGTAPARRVASLVGSVASGAVALRSRSGAVGVALLTGAVYLSTVASLMAVATATGLGLSPLQAAFVAAAIALSTAIPAAPGSVGTYEFVGSAALIALGFGGGAALATVVLVHVIAIVPTSLAGLAAAWVYELRFSTLAQATPEQA